MDITRLQDTALFLGLWVLGGIVGYSVGFPAGLYLGGTLAWGWIIGGSLFILWQYLLLRRRVAQALWWIAASAVGLITGTGVSLAVSQIAIQFFGLTAAFILVGASVGLGLGLGQWVVLRTQFRWAYWWAAASTAGYALGLLAAVNTPLSLPAGPSLVFGPEFGGTLGAVSGVTTAPVLVWLTLSSTADLGCKG